MCWHIAATVTRGSEGSIPSLQLLILLGERQSLVATVDRFDSGGELRPLAGGISNNSLPLWLACCRCGGLVFTQASGDRYPGESLPGAAAGDRAGAWVVSKSSDCIRLKTGGARRATAATHYLAKADW